LWIGSGTPNSGENSAAQDFSALGARPTSRDGGDAHLVFSEMIHFPSHLPVPMLVADAGSSQPDSADGDFVESARNVYEPAETAHFRHPLRLDADSAGGDG